MFGMEPAVYHPQPGGGLSVARLDEDIDLLYVRTADSVSENGVLAAQCQDLLQQARRALRAPDPDQAAVEAQLERVRMLLERAERSVDASRAHAPALAAYGAAWLAVLLFLVVFDREIALWVGARAGRTDLVSLSGLAPFWMCMAWAGIGAAAGSLYDLYRAVAQRDFVPEQRIGYLVQPVLGVAVGAVVYLVVAAAFFLVGEGAGFAAVQITAVNPLALASALAGFGQRHVYRLMESAVARLLRASPAAAPGSETEA
jgi:hypothetical protein